METKIRALVDLLKKGAEILILTSEQNIDSFFDDIKVNAFYDGGAYNYGTFKNSKNIASSLGVKSIYIDGKTIHFMSDKNIQDFAEKMRA